MSHVRTLALVAGALALTTTGALAQATGNPSDPYTLQNQQPGPGVANPTDPAAGDSMGAREPTAPVDEGAASSGASSGDAGLGYQAPAGNPADPSTEENQQPGPSVNNPTDPAAGSNPDAREPTAP